MLITDDGMNFSCNKCSVWDLCHGQEIGIVQEELLFISEWFKMYDYAWYMKDHFGNL